MSCLQHSAGWVLMVAVLCWGATAQGQTSDAKAGLRMANERGLQLQAQGKQAEAIPQFEYALRLAPGAYGDNHIVTALVQRNLAGAYFNTGQYAKAEPLYLRCLATREAQLGKQDPGVASVLNDLGDVYHKMAQHAKAEPLYLRSLQIRQARLGEQHLDVGTTRFNLANLYRDMARYAEAEPLYQRSLKIREAQLGGNHPDVAEVVNSLANLYLYKGQYPQALPLYQRSLRIQEARLGRNHPDVARTVSNLALIHDKMGQYSQAEPLFQRSLTIKEAQTVRDEVSIAATLYSLANLYSSTARYTEAESTYKRSLQIRETKLGANHPDVALTLADLANVLVTLSRHAEAEPLYQRSLRIREARLGKDHPEVANTLVNLAALNDQMGRYVQAESLYQRVLQIQEAKLGKDHPDVASTLNNLALVTMRLGQFSRVEALYHRSLQIREARLGKDHPDVAASLVNLANLYRVTDKTSQAEPLLQRSLQIREAKLGTSHPDVAVTLSSQGLLYLSTNRYAQAEPLLQRSLRIQEAKFDRDHPSVAATLKNLGTLCWALGQNDRAESMHLRALQIYEAQLGKEHPHVAGILHDLALVYAAQERWPEAATAADRSRRMVRRHVAQVLPALSEAEQLSLLENTDANRFHAALSIGVKRQTDLVLVAQSAGWMLNGKAITQQALVEQAYQARDNKDPATARMGQQLADVRKQLAAWIVAPEKPERIAERQRHMGRLKGQEQELAKQLAQATGRARRDEPWVEADEVRQALSNDAILIDILRVDVRGFRGSEKNPGPHYVAWLIPAAGQGEIKIIDLGEAAPIETAVQNVRKVLMAADQTIRTRGEADAEKELRPSLETLTALVLKPLAGQIRDKPRWIVSPDGALWLVPWEALAWDDGYVIEKHKLSYVVSGRDLIPVPPPATKTNMPLMMANPDFDLGVAQIQLETQRILTEAQMQTLLRSPARSLRLGPVQRLPGTAAEAEAVRPNLERFAQAKPLVYTGRHALEGVFKVFARPKVAVLSTHGFFQDDQAAVVDRTGLNLGEHGPARTSEGQPLENPLLRCGLLLAGVNRRAEATDPNQDDGVLTGLEIVSADLRGTELVVLSACETGLGQVRNGEGVAGLRQAFHLAGAQTVVATLWQISDAETARLMNDFFINLADGQSKSDALRNAQLKRMQSRREDFGAAHPFLWAAFTLTGK